MKIKQVPVFYEERVSEDRGASGRFQLYVLLLVMLLSTTSVNKSLLVTTNATV